MNLFLNFYRKESIFMFKIIKSYEFWEEEKYVYNDMFLIFINEFGKLLLLKGLFEI